jgi:hypothetical protein
MLTRCAVGTRYAIGKLDRPVRVGDDRGSSKANGERE